jgi:tRNA A-37 threonylcarbamoyl transferase component Bud32
MTPSNPGNSPHEDRVNRIIAAYLQSVEQGKPLDRQELLVQHPDLVEELTEFFADRDRFEKVASPLRAAAAGSASGDLPMIDLSVAPPPAASSAFMPPSVEELAARFPQLEIIELIGKGGMGAVYKARQPDLDRLVALKILPREIGADPAFSERFTREARALAKLSHPNIVTVYDFGRTADGLFYFLMELVDGINLRQAIRAGSMSPKEALAIVPQICDALQFAHDERIVHRDIKPENVLLDKKGRVKIADFGLAKLLGKAPSDVSLTGTQQVMGTLRYMAPEQLEGSKTVDHRADIYSLGVVFYELLTGEVPVGRFAPPSKKVQIDVRLDEVVLRALEEKPEQRYQHASDIKTEVESIGVQGGSFGAGPNELEREVITKSRAEGKIAAIRFYRERTGAGLAEAKSAVERITAGDELPIKWRYAVIGLAALIAIFLLGILGIGLNLSVVIAAPLFLLGICLPLSIAAWKHRGTERGQLAALSLTCLGIMFATAIWGEADAILDWLYSRTGASPGAHDAVFLRTLAGLFIVIVVWQMVRFLIVQYRARRQIRTSMPTAGPMPAELHGQAAPPAATVSDVVLRRVVGKITLVLITLTAAMLLGLQAGYLAKADWYFKRELPFEYLSEFLKVWGGMSVGSLIWWWYLLAKAPGAVRSFADFFRTMQGPDQRVKRLWLPLGMFLLVWIVAEVFAMNLLDDTGQTVVSSIFFVIGPYLLMLVLWRNYRTKQGECQANKRDMER